MAKNKQVSTPSTHHEKAPAPMDALPDDFDATNDTEVDISSRSQPAQAAMVIDPITVTGFMSSAICLPGTPAVGYISRHADCNELTTQQATALRRLWIGLEESGARLANGNRVVSAVQAIKWLLEQFHREYAEREAQ